MSSSAPPIRDRQAGRKPRRVSDADDLVGGDGDGITDAAIDALVEMLVAAAATDTGGRRRAAADRGPRHE